MHWRCKTISVICSFLLISVSIAQHPDRIKIDSLKGVLPGLHGINRINCLNDLSEEYWWAPHVYPDTISLWARPAFEESGKISYALGGANATMHLGVADIYRKKYSSAEKYLREALDIFEGLGYERGIGWTNLWLGQTLYSESNFIEGIESCKKSILILEKLHESESLGKAWAWMGFLYGAIGEYDSNFKYSSKSLQIREKMSDHMCVSGSLTNMGYLYRSAHDYEDALDYYQQGLAYARAHDINPFEIKWNYMDEPTGVIYGLLNKPDSALFYIKKSIEIDSSNKLTYVALGEFYLKKNEYDSALILFLNPIEGFRKGYDRLDLMRVLLDAGQAYLAKGNPRMAIQFLFEAYTIATQTKARQYLVNSYNFLSKAYESLDKMDSANYFLKRYIALNDSVFDSQLRFQLSTYKEKLKRDEELFALNKDNEIKQKELERASMVTWILISGLIFVIMSALILYRGISLKRKNEKLQNRHLQQEIQLRALESERVKADLQQKTTQLEMEVLRAQMNPHFIFNSLNSINRFVLKNDKEQASEYLTIFSKLVRMILQNSQEPLVVLESELESLKLYLELEALRFNYHFEYCIRIVDGLDDSSLKVPPLCIQPYVENAIWHGLMHKEEKGKLVIEIDQDDDNLIIKVEDNGVGRLSAAQFSSKSTTRHKSMGLDITAQRIKMLQGSKTRGAPVTINDLVNTDGSPAGTEVIIKMPLIYD